MNAVILLFMLLASIAFCSKVDVFQLSPHEVQLYEALNNIKENPDQIKLLVADNAILELACGKYTVRHGSYDEVIDIVLPKLDFIITRIYPITTTNDTYPDHGVFSFKWINFVRTKESCEAIFSGFAYVKVSCCAFVR